MKKIVLFIFGLAALMFASCGQKEKNVKQLEQQYLVQPVDSFSGKDTSEVMYLVNSFIDKLNQKDIKSAVSMLSYLDGNDIVPLPAELVKRQCNALANAQGVKYTVDRLVFNEEKDNIVKVNILLFEKKPGDTRPNSISLYLKPIRRDNRWYLTTVDNITDSNNMGGTQIQN